MNNQNRIGSFLLFPPVVLWIVIVMFMFDNTLAQYFFSRMNMQVLDFVFFIAGLVFPAAALVVGVRGVLVAKKKRHKAYDYFIIALSSLMLTLMVLIVFVF